jgi:hypothetical protein
VVDGLPVVPEAKHEKLAGVLNKIYSQIGHVREGEFSPAAAVIWGAAGAVGAFAAGAPPPTTSFLTAAKVTQQ